MAPDLDATGKVRGIYCTEYDIHDLKLTEQALATREEQLRLFTDNIPEPVVYLDTEGSYMFVNEAFLTCTGSRREDVIGKLPADVLGAEAAAEQSDSRRTRRPAKRHLRARGRSTPAGARAGSAPASFPTYASTARSRGATSSATTSRT